MPILFAMTYSTYTHCLSHSVWTYPPKRTYNLRYLSETYIWHVYYLLPISPEVSPLSSHEKTSNFGDYPRQSLMGPFLTKRVYVSPLKMQILKIRLFHVRKGSKCVSQNVMTLKHCKWRILSRTTANSPINYTEGIWQPRLEIEIRNKRSFFVR